MRVPRVRPLTAAVVGISAALTLGLAWTAHMVNANSDRRLLVQQVQQAAAALSSALPVIQSQLVQTVQVVGATNANPQIFTNFATPIISRNRSMVAVSLWNVSGDQPRQLAIAGKGGLVLPSQHLAGAFFARLHPSDTLFVTPVLDSSPPRIGFAEMPPGGPAGLVVYAESALNPGRHLTVPKSSPFADLQFAMYLGHNQTASQLIAASSPTPIPGHRASTTVPFGDTVITLIGSSNKPLAGSLSSVLPWIVLAAGGALSVASGLTTEFVGRRRRDAERLASDNARLYRQQRDIAVTLQQALLPAVPHVDGVEVAVRYLAGVADLEVGGDWYDVICPDKEHVVFFVGDVSGRGLPAATTMASLRYAIRAYVAQGDCIETVLSKVGSMIDVETDHHFATVIAGEIDLVRGRVTLSSAGHFPPLLIADDDDPSFVAMDSQPPIGVVVPAPPTTVAFDVAGEVTLLAFTDGAIERRGESIDVGLERLRCAAAASAGSLDQFADRLIARLVPGGADDDVVLLALRWHA